MALYLCLPLLVMLLQPVQCLYNCSSEYQRTPGNSDLMVQCGTSMITLDINLCTVLWAGFNATELALNSQYSNTACQGSVDTSVNPPVVHFQLPVNQSQDNSCRQSLQIVDEKPDPTGPFSSFLSIQAVVVTGYIDTPRSNQGLISYSTDLYYHFSCRYPLEYLLNNTQIAASSVSVATSNNNGTFINSLKMSVFNDSNYNSLLVVPPTGLELRTKIYVEVKADNLTQNFNLLLDRCFATPTPYNMSQSVQYDFFTGCNIANRTTVMSNGVSKVARFNFEAFRFVQDRNQAKSSIYVHCMLRLCEPSTCQQIQNCANNRRKRSLVPFGKESSESTTISVGPLYTAKEDSSNAEDSNTVTSGSDGHNMTGLIVRLLSCWVLVAGLF
ncbi:zona pellucida-like domain-containing protein 1 isoform X2 [Oreochromis aureus]|nr:zona pellucida-like domain-containing protein 1 isoform X2 [Oreochromis aureus]XP_039453972.1 zona pellucida-like domain-containing protein 1 isoform X2 [Oreochromis aureus]